MQPKPQGRLQKHPKIRKGVRSTKLSSLQLPPTFRHIQELVHGLSHISACHSLPSEPTRKKCRSAGSVSNSNIQKQSSLLLHICHASFSGWFGGLRAVAKQAQAEMESNDLSTPVKPSKLHSSNRLQAVLLVRTTWKTPSHASACMLSYAADCA